MQTIRHLAAAALSAAILSACSAAVDTAAVGGNSHVGIRGSMDLNNGRSSVTPYGQVGAGVEYGRPK